MAIRITGLPNPEKQLEQSQNIKLQDPTQGESAIGTLGRGALRTAARVGETAAGSVGNVLQTVGDIGLGALRRIDPNGLGRAPDFASPFPTSGQLQKGTEALTGEYLKPQGKGEEAVDDFVSDVTALAMPGFLGKGKFVSKFGTNLKKAVGIAGAGNVAGFLAEKAGTSKGTAEGVKMATMLGTSFGIAGGVNRAMNNAYKTAEKIAPGQATVSARQAYDQLLQLEQSVGERAFEGKDKILEILKPMISAFKEGKNIDFSQAWQLTKDANTWYSKLGSGARTELSKITKIFRDDIFSKAASTITDPALRPLVKDAAEGILFGNELYRDTHTASRVRQWMNDNISLTKFTAGGLISNYLGLPTKGIGIGVAGVKAGINFLEPIVRSPAIRKIYKNMIKTGLRENLPATLNQMQKLDKKLTEEYPELVSQYSKPAGKVRITSLGQG